MQTQGIEIHNAKDITTPYTRWFLYGPTGSGKTTAAATFPNPFFILPKNENSILTVAGRDIDYVLVDSRASMDRVLTHLATQYQKMMQLFSQNKDDAANEAFPWQTVVVENMSHYCELLVEDISRGGQNKMDMQAWGLLSNHLRNVHSSLSDLDVHTVYTSLDTIDDNGVGRPMMTGKNAIIMPSSCDVIGHCETVNKGKDKPPAYRMHFIQAGRFPARSRFKSFPPHVDGFDFKTFESLLGAS
jgi:hypothetical protein